MNNIIADVESKLNNIKAPYTHFVRSILAEAKAFQRENPLIWEQLYEYLVKHNNLSASDVCDYMSYLIGLPYGDDNGKWYRWDQEISEEEARKIVDEKYSD